MDHIQMDAIDSACHNNFHISVYNFKSFYKFEKFVILQPTPNQHCNGILLIAHGLEKVWF